MIRDRNIVCFASNWDYDPTSKHHVMRILSRRNHVVWVNYHASRRPRAMGADLRAIVGRTAAFVAGARRVSESMTVLTPMVVPLPGSAAARRINRELLVRQVRRVLRRLPPRPVQVWSFAPDLGVLRGALGEELFLYYCVDAFGEFAGCDAAAVRMEEERTMACAELVVATSGALFERAAALNRATLYLPHGVDYDYFSGADGAPLPHDAADLRRPVLGFFGLIGEWVDVELLAEAARARPAWTFVLIGECRADVSALRGYANVRLLGRRGYRELPGYCRCFDAGLIPFRRSALTESVNPIKLREYLAAGLPVASTGLPEVRRFASLVEMGDGVEGFVAACERALGARDPAARAARRAAVRGESWEAKVRELSARVAALTRPAVDQSVMALSMA